MAAGVVYLIYQRHRKAGGENGRREESPKDILKRRDAGREISREGFERLKKEIEG